MRIGVVSDTHNRLPNVQRIVELLNEARVERVVHTGDITQARTLHALGGLRAPLVGVFGNNDEREPLLEAARELGCELHDCFATAELLHYENLGLCKDGEAGKLIDDGTTALGGKVPVNVSGGLLSKGHPLGATGIANVYEVSTHLRGEAGKRQVPNARFGMTHVIGLGSACAIHILEKAN